MDYTDALFTPQNLVALLALIALEVALGVDNLIFLSLQCQKLPAEQRPLAQRIGLIGAMFMRLALLFSITWVMGLDAAALHLFGRDLSWKDLILIGGGLYLAWHAVREMHDAWVGQQGEHAVASVAASSFARVIVSVMLLDAVFSLDSVLTAVGMVKAVPVMATAIVTTVLVMLFAAAPVTRFLERYPTFKNLALSFLLLIGVVLVSEGFGYNIPKGLVYGMVGFGLFNEVFNTFARGAGRKPQ